MKPVRTLCILALLMMVSVPPVSHVEGTRGERTGYFSGIEVYSSGRSFSGGIGTGDIDGDGKNELVACDLGGDLLMLEEVETGAFVASVIYTEPKESAEVQGLFDLVVGDILLDRPGMEVAVGGYSKNLTVVYRDGDRYSSKVIYESPRQIFNIIMADFDPGHQGEEVLLASFDPGTTEADADRMVRVVYRDGSGFKAEEIALPATPKGLEVADIDPKAGGKEIWATTSARSGNGGTISVLYEISRGRTVTERYRDPSKLIANIKAGDIWSGNPGNELLMVDFGGTCRMLWEEDGLYKTREVFTATDSLGSPALLEAIETGDVNPLHEGVEGIVTGYFNDVTQVVEVDGGISADAIWRAGASDIQMEITGISIGDVSSVHDGNEVAVCSRAGWIDMVHYEEDGLSLWADRDDIDMENGVERTFQIEVIPQGLARGPLTLSAKGGEGLDFVFPRISIDGHDPVLVDIRVSSDLDGTSTKVVPFSLEASIGDVKALPLQMQATVTMSGSVELVPSTIVVYPELAVDRIVSLTLKGSERANLTVTAPVGIRVNAPSVLLRDRKANVAVFATKETGTYEIGLEGTSGSRVVFDTTITVIVRPLSDDMDIGMSEMTEDTYRVILDYHGARLGFPVQVDILIGTDRVNSTLLNLTGPSVVEFDFTYRGDSDRIVRATVSPPGGEGYSVEIGTVSKVQEMDEFPVGLLLMFLLVMGLGAVLVFLLLNKMRPKEDDYTGIERIGPPTQYNRAAEAKAAGRPMQGRGPRAASIPPVKGMAPQRGKPRHGENAFARGRVLRRDTGERPPST